MGPSSYKERVRKVLYLCLFPEGVRSIFLAMNLLLYHFPCVPIEIVKKKGKNIIICGGHHFGEI